jgi:hypothetical protein
MAHNKTVRGLPDEASKPGLSAADLCYAVTLINNVCALAGPPNYLRNLRTSARTNGLVAAVRDHTTSVLFEWLANAASFQGISDQVARNYMAKHGQSRWDETSAALAEQPSCPKLASYWHFYGCRYQKGNGSCAEPEHINCCPVPFIELRNGNLNQLSYSLFLFIRDLADGDIVGWIDNRLAASDDEDPINGGYIMGQSLVTPLRHIFGVSDKVLNMVLATLLLGAGQHKARWSQAGASLLAVDSLVHNFLARTGILERAHASHPYGPRCYGPHGCAEILRTISFSINAQNFQTEFPRHFPRFIQSAVWRYCAADKLNVCNGNQIDDLYRCQNSKCRIMSFCDRLALKQEKMPIS